MAVTAGTRQPVLLAPVHCAPKSAALSQHLELSIVTPLRARLSHEEPEAGNLQQEGFEAVLSRKPRAMPAVARIFDGEKEAKLIALAWSKPPKGRARWTLRLLENKVVELGIVDRASDSTIGRTLKKTFFSPIASSNGLSRRRPTARS